MGSSCSSARTSGSPPPPYLRSAGASGSSETANGNANSKPNSKPNALLSAKPNPSVQLSPSEVLKQKAEEFWNEIKDIKIPDVTSGKSADEIIDDIIEHERVHNGIDWKAAARGGRNEMQKAVSKAHEHLKEIRNSFNDDDVHMAKSMGLLDEQGNVGHYDLLAQEDGATGPGLAPIPSTAAPYVVWGWNKKQTENYQNASGGRVKDLIVNLIRNFQVMQNDSTRYLVKTFMEAGLWGLGAYGLNAVWKIVRTLAELSEATEAFAVLEGVITVGVNVIKLGITVVILAILVPLFIYMTKDAAGIMVIINDTNEDMRLVDLHCTHGKVVGIFKENAKLDNPQPIIPKKLPPIVNPKTGKIVAEGSIQAGFFAARKRDAALIGSQGALKFEQTASYPKGVYIGWEVPLSRGSNRLLLSADYTGSASGFSDKTDDDGTQDLSVVSSKNARLTGHVNSGSGSEAYYIISITEPATALLTRAPKELSVEEKAADFWESMKHIQLPDVTKGKTSDQVIDDIIDHENLYHGIDWRAAAKQGGKALLQATSKAHLRLQKIRKKMTSHEVENGKAMGLLDAHGNVPEYDLLGASEVAEPNLAPIPSGAAPYTVWGWNPDHAAKYQNATGERIKDLICNLIRNFQVMNDDDERFMVKSFMDAGLWGLGLFGLIAVWKIIATLSELTEATTALAVLTGIDEVGVNLIKLGITTVILAILVPIFILMTKDAAAMMVIVNDTDEDLDLADIHATHGKIVGIFKESAKLDNPQPIIPKRLPPIYNKKGKLVCKGSVQAGLLATRKHDSALIGTQGAFKFSPTPSYPLGISIGWEVPLSQGSNRLLVSASFNGSASQYSDKTNDDGKQEDSSVSSKSAKITGRVHSGSGSKGYYVFNVTQPAKTMQAEAPSEKEVPKEEAEKFRNEIKDVTDPPNSPELLGSTPSPAQDTLHQRAEKLWNEIKDIEVPDVTTGKSADELINDIIDHEKKEHGIDWRAAAEAGGDALDSAVKKAHGRLKAIREKMDKKDLDTAISMGLLNSKGEVPEYDLLAKDYEEPPLLNAMVGAAETVQTVPIPSSAAPYMVWGWKASRVTEFQRSSGNDIKTKIAALIRGFQAMKDDKSNTMTKAFMNIGLWGIGAVGIRAAWRILSTAAEVTEAVEAAAVADGIAVIGASVITLGIATCILAVLVPLFIFMSKNAAAIMVIINDTDEDMSMVDLHATHGKVVGIFKESAALDNPHVVIPKKLPPIVNPTTKKIVLQGSVQAGFFAAKKRDSALFGTQGAMKFAPTTRFAHGVYVGWEVPLTMGSNRLLVSADYSGSASEFSNRTNDENRLEDHSVSKNESTAQVTGRVNSSGGSEAYYVISIT